jgi:hypothetical protein
MNIPFLAVDVAHPARAQDDVEAELLDALARVRSSRDVRLLKIVHGYGASGRGGTTKTVVQNWLHRRRKEVRKILPGETYDLLDPDTQMLRSEVGQYPDPDLGNANRGITIVWVW